MILDSEKVIINASSQEIIQFLQDSRNINELLPQDSIKDFQADERQCSFKVQGGITISLMQNGSTGSSLLLKSGDITPFPFDLIIKLNPITETQTEGNIHFDGEVNMFLKMIVEKPLLSLFDYMSKRMKEKFQ